MDNKNVTLYGMENDMALLQFLRSKNTERFTKLDAFCYLIGKMSGQANFTSEGSAVKTAAIRSYQNQLLALAQNALVAVEPAKRNISSLLVGVDDECFDDLNEMTLEFRRQVQKRTAEVKNVNRAMQFVFALYPVAEVSSGNPKKEE